jgi:energy-coupling factor transporter ATP-binding protein EcfA2
MIIKNEIFELEISEGIGVYFGSKASGQHFKKWEEFREEEKRQIEMIQHTVEDLLKTSERTFLTDSNKRAKEGM